jgi:AcrR family transcriptional regulator
MPRRRKDGEETKKHIAEKARTLFAQKGYAATSIEDISSASGSSKGSIYYHFKSKESLFIYLLEENMNKWVEDWEKKSHLYTTSSEKLYGLAEHFADDLQDPLMRAAEEFGGSQMADPEILKQVFELVHIPRKTYENILAEGIANGEFKQEKLRDLTYILEGLLGGLSSFHHEMDFAELKALCRKAISILLNGIATDKNT